MVRSLLVAGILLAVSLLAGCMGGGGAAGSGQLKAEFSYSPGTPQPGQDVSFKDESTGPIEQRVWTFGDGKSSTEPNPVHRYAFADIFEVTLTVRDGDGNSVSARHFVAVGSSLGDGSIKVQIQSEVKGLMVSFDPVVTPSSADVSAYFWDFGDGSVSRERAPIHEYGAPDNYLVTLRVVADGGRAETKSLVTVGSFATLGPLADRSFAVIALVDTGVNPYHEEFRDAAFQAHPSSYINDYPPDAEPLHLSLGASQYRKAVELDAETWDAVQPGLLYYVPGTRIVGAISSDQDGATPILDENGHGTATASIAAGSSIGACPSCLIVIVEGLGEAGLRWAMKQAWIDIVSNSWGATGCLGTCLPVDHGVLYPASLYGISTDASKKAVEEGRTILFASGNGWLNAFDVPQVSYLNAYTGPDWIVTVGAADSRSGATVLGTGRPVDIVSFGWDWKGAAHDSMTSIDGFSGTSSATPLAAGVFGFALEQARDALNDTLEGPRGKGVAAEGTAPADLGSGSPLADGTLTRAELQRSVYLTARRATGTGPVGIPTMVPDSPAYFTYAGYGVVDHDTAASAAGVLLGKTAAPARAAEDAWASADSSIRVALWGSWDDGGQDVRPLSVHQGLTLVDVDTLPEAEAWLAEGYAAYGDSV